MLSGVILAGGQNRRMNGKIKALLPFHEQLLIQRQIKEMQKICGEVIIVTNEPKPLLPVVDKNIRIITDYIAGKGAMSGMHAAFQLAKNPLAWVVGADMPFISSEAASLLWERVKLFDCDAALFRIGGAAEPLHAVYHTSTAAALTALLHAGETRLSELLNIIYSIEIGEAELKSAGIGLEFVTAIKTEEDYQLALAALNASGVHRNS